MKKQDKKIKILDCTLRDGGYLTDWFFGEKSISTVLTNLHGAGVDFIECGFLKKTSSSSGRTFFNSIEELSNLIIKEQNYTLMVNFGEYDIANFLKCKTPNVKIRVAFKKHNQSNALLYISELKNLGWDVYANPMNTNTYSKEELLFLISEINFIKPKGLFIVDTLGNMYEDELIKIFQIIDQNLDSQIAIGFHSHNSLQLSLSNAKALIKMQLDRELIIDSCLYGMGRGAGNLCTELVTKYLNDNFATQYKIFPILKTIESVIKPIYSINPWGYSTPYYIAAIHSCHPNYATYLLKHQVTDEEIDAILQQIPETKKTNYDERCIEQIAKKIFLTVSK